MARLKVTGPLAIVRDESGAQVYFYEGATLPSYVRGAQATALLDTGLVGELEDVPDEPVPDDPAPEPRVKTGTSSSSTSSK